MSSQTGSTLTQWRPAILGLTVVAAAFGAYYLQSSFWASSRNNQLHRSNTVRRNFRRRQTEPMAEQTDQAEIHDIDGLTFLLLYTSCPEFSGTYTHGDHSLPLIRRIPSIQQFQEQFGVGEEEASRIRQDYEEQLLMDFICKNVPLAVKLFDWYGDVGFIRACRDIGFMFPNVAKFIVARFNAGDLNDHPARRALVESSELQASTEARLRELLSSIRSGANDDGTVVGTTSGRLGVDPAEMDATDEDSELSWGEEDENDEASKEGQSLLNMLYHIAADQARRDGFVHRGITCNACGVIPIRGIRYRCANCSDFDLCEQCESGQVHSKTHIFYKLRIPIPSLSDTKHHQPVWYPGRPSELPNQLPREIGKRFVSTTGLEPAKVDALWDQFRCLAGTRWRGDPDGFGLAIDRQTFEACFLPSTRAIRKPPASMIFDRMFSYYDTNGDGLIGFVEFISGIATFRSKDQDERIKRIFRGYDHDRDGFVSRRDFLSMLKAYYEFMQEYIRDMISVTEDDVLDPIDLRDNLSGTRPISALFPSQDIPTAARSRHGEAKVLDRYGDLVTGDNSDFIREIDLQKSPEEIVADVRERATFGDVNESLCVRTGDRGSEESRGGTALEGGVMFQLLSSLNERLREQPNYVTGSDIIDALGTTVPFTDQSLEQQTRVLEHASQRIEKEKQNREAVRKTAIEERRQRREFYHDSLGSTAARQQIGPNANAGVSEEITATRGYPRILPRPESDINREFLYQITLEGLNELLDTVFRQREDLAMEILRSEDERSRLKVMINGYCAVHDNRTLCRALSARFQTKWRLSQVAPNFGLDKSMGLELLGVLLNESLLGTPENIQAVCDKLDAGLFNSTDLERTLDDLVEHGFKREASMIANVQRVQELFPEVAASHFRKSFPRDESEEEQASLAADNRVDVLSREEASVYVDDAVAPEAAQELHDSVRASNEADPAVETMIVHCDLDDLLASSGYAMTEETEPPGRGNPTVLAKVPDASVPDPTLPQHRPHTVASTPWPLYPQLQDVSDSCPRSRIYGTIETVYEHDPLEDPNSAYFQIKLKMLAVLHLIALEDEERGGPGRLSFQEFAELLKGPKGTRLGFLGSWAEMASF